MSSAAFVFKRLICHTNATEIPPAPGSELRLLSPIVAFATQPVAEALMDAFRKIPVLLIICCDSSLAETPDLRVTVRVYDGVELPSGDIRRAEQEAEKIFLYAGIQLVWTNGDTPMESWKPAVLQLRIWPRAVAGKRPRSADTLGFCISLESGDAVVLADAIEKRAVYGTTNFADLLGLAMAHELGHLLLQSAKHSVTGIMRARWTETSLSDDDRGYLRFTVGEREALRKEVRRRMGLHLLAPSLSHPLERRGRDPRDIGDQ